MRLIIVLAALSMLATAGGVIATPQAARAAACGAGPYRAGCVGPNGAVVTNRGPAVHCAAGVYRAGCAGPNGAVVTRRAPPPAPVHCAAGAYRAGCVGPNGAVVTRR